ncbi:MAG: hypothetical protein IPL52_08005 [Flavobacteriales bacterium]|nr:hypothetical protein [Flavobacteriales bacterium]
MNLKSVVAVLALVVSQASAQSPAGVQRVHARYSQEQIADMQLRAPYKYNGLVLFYSSSFLVIEEDALRPASEEEIAIIDLHQHDAIRRVGERVRVFDPLLGKGIVLLGRDEFEQVVLSNLSEPDRVAYLNYKAAALRDHEAKQP